MRNHRDYKATDFRIAELSWLWGVNRGILTPPGLDEQWLVSLAHQQAEMDVLVNDFRRAGPGATRLTSHLPRRQARSGSSQRRRSPVCILRALDGRRIHPGA